MSGYVDHGWRHAPKALGGTDPTPTVASGGPITALGLAGSRSQSMSGLVLDFDFDDIVTNDASFGYEVVTSGRAQYITISTEGWYRGRFVVFFNSDFTAGDFPFLQPTCYVLGADDVLVNSAAWSLTDERNIANNQDAAGELTRHVLSCTLDFQFTAADFGDSPVGIGMRIVANNNRTKFFGGQLELTWLGSALSALTIT